MKKMEFMRRAAKIILEFLAKSYENEDITRISISTQKQKGSYQISDEGGFFKLFTYMTGEISYCHGSSFFKTHTDYAKYYTYNENDNHEEVLKQFAKDLKMLKKYLHDIYILSSDYEQYNDMITFEYGKPVTFNLNLGEE